MIKNVAGWIGNSKVQIPIPKNKKIKTIEVSLSKGRKFEINLDEDGDISIIGSGDLSVVFSEENQTILRLKK